MGMLPLSLLHYDIVYSCYYHVYLVAITISFHIVVFMLIMRKNIHSYPLVGSYGQSHARRQMFLSSTYTRCMIPDMGGFSSNPVRSHTRLVSERDEFLPL